MTAPKPFRPNWDTRTEKVQGILLHYDESATDAGAVAWFRHPDCRVSYHYLVLDNGTPVNIAPVGTRAWHAGRCRPSNPERLDYRDANSAFYGVAIAANHKDTATPAQVATVVRLCQELFTGNDWPRAETWRISSHHLEAWPRGRKVDTKAPDGRWVLDLDEVRRLVAA